MNPHAPSDAALRLLYVEDDRLCALLFEESIRLLPGVEVRLAEDGAEALDHARAWRPDVLVLDAHLPGMDGFQLLELLRREAGLDGLPAFMCSADAAPEDVDRATRAGFTGYWPKPIDIARITDDLRRIRVALAPARARA